MEPILPITALPATRTEARDLDLTEVDAAIELVPRGTSRLVRFVDLRATCVEAVAAMERGRMASVAAALERTART